MLEVFEWTLKRCGSSLVEVTQSRSFAQLLKRQKMLCAKPASTRNRIALSAGHLEMGRLLNCCSEREALEAAEGRASASFSPEERSLIFSVGETIISAAKKCLPDSVIELAHSWKQASIEEQKEIVRQLYFLFRSEHQETKGKLSTEMVFGKLLEKPVLDHQLDTRGFLPGLYGKWDRDTCPANCQGKAQMIAAFAKEAGAASVMVHPLIHAGDVRHSARTCVRDAVHDDLRARNLLDACAEFTDGVEASHLEDIMQRSSFHVGVALQLRDSSWIMLDPHGLCWGQMSSAWNMDRMVTLLKRYRDVLPGLTIIGRDGGEAERLLQAQKDIAIDLIERSRRMEQLIADRVTSVGDLIQVVFESEDFDLLMRLTREQQQHDTIDLSDPEYRRYAAMVLVVGPENLMDIFLMFDPVFIKSRIKMWLTFYHVTALNVFLNKETDEGKIVHPVCEFSASTPWSIAISALNSASFSVGRSRPEADECFMRNSFDQVTLFNAMTSSNRSLGFAARETLGTLPFLHPLCRWRIGGSRKEMR